MRHLKRWGFSRQNSTPYFENLGLIQGCFFLYRGRKTVLSLALHAVLYNIALLINSLDEWIDPAATGPRD